MLAGVSRSARRMMDATAAAGRHVHSIESGATSTHTRCGQERGTGGVYSVRPEHVTCPQCIERISEERLAAGARMREEGGDATRGGWIPSTPAEAGQIHYTANREVGSTLCGAFLIRGARVAVLRDQVTCSVCLEEIARMIAALAAPETPSPFGDMTHVRRPNLSELLQSPPTKASQ
jgi:hypothetical protein